MLQSPSQTPELALFDVVVTEFEARVEAPVSRIMRVFDVDQPTAQALVAALPAMVCQGVNRMRAAHFARALLSIGGRIEVRDQAGAPVELSRVLDGARNSGEVQAEQTLAANDNDNEIAAPAAATLFRGSDALADTLGATPTLAPQPPRLSRAEIEVLQHEPTSPRIATPQPASAATPGWGELQRAPMRARAPSQPLAAISEELASELLVPQAAPGPGPREFEAQESSDQRLSLEPSHAAMRAASQPLTAAGQHPAMRGATRPLSGQLGQPPTAAGQHPAMRGATRPLSGQLGQPPTAAGQHPAMRGATRPLSGQLSQPLPAAEFLGSRPGARAQSGKLPKGAEPVAPARVETAAGSGTEQSNDWSDLELPALQANAELGAAADSSLGSPTTHQGPRLDTLDLSGPSLSIDPRALRAVATRGGVTYEAGPGRARKAAAEDSGASRGGGKGPEAASRGRGVRGPDGTNGPSSARGDASRGGGSASTRGAANAAPAFGPAAAIGGEDQARGANPRQADRSTSIRRGAGKDGGVARSSETEGAHPNQRGSSARRALANENVAAGRASATHAESSHDESEFWESFADTLAFPFRGSGITWLVSIAVWAIVGGGLSVLALTAPLAGLTVMFFGNSSVLAICADYHRRCTWAVVNHDNMLVQGPEFDPTHILQEYMRAGTHIAAFAVLSQLPLALWLAIAIGHDEQHLLDLSFSAHFWLLAALPSLYWPMAVTTASLYNRCSGVWYVPIGIRAILRAPLMYFAIFAAGALAFMVPWFVFAAVAREAGIPGSLLLAIAGFPMAASHGVMGALTGLLMRSKSNLFA